MTVQELIEFLQHAENKDLDVFIMGDEIDVRPEDFELNEN